MLLRTAQNDISFVYPAGSGSLANASKLKSAKLASGSFSDYDFAENMSIVAIGKGLETGDKILAYVNGKLRGIAESSVINGKELNFISVAGGLKNDNTVVFKLERNGKAIASAPATISYQSNAVAGSLLQPLVIDFSQTGKQASIYPNPFKTSLNIDIKTNEGDNVEIVIFDMLGRIVMQQEEVSSGALYSTSWNSTGNTPAGVYQLRITVNGESNVYKLVKE
jgi:hypothetical protein